MRGYAAVLDAVHPRRTVRLHATGGAIGAFTAEVTWPAEGTTLPNASRDASGALALGWPAEWPAPRVALLGADGAFVSVCAVRTNGARGTVSGREVRSVARGRLDFVRLDLVAVSADTNVRIEAHDVRDIDVR